MISLGYELSPSWNRRAEDVDLRAASEMTLRYECFLGDIAFVVDGVDFSARWGWVPVLDLALGLRSIAGALVEGEERVFEFTESDATIVFRRHGGTVEVTASYVDGAAEVPYVELSLESERFVARVLEDVRRGRPEFAQNAFIGDLSRTLTLPA